MRNGKHDLGQRKSGIGPQFFLRVSFDAPGEELPAIANRPYGKLADKHKTSSSLALFPGKSCRFPKGHPRRQRRRTPHNRFTIKQYMNRRQGWAPTGDIEKLSTLCRRSQGREGAAITLWKRQLIHIHAGRVIHDKTVAPPRRSVV